MRSVRFFVVVALLSIARDAAADDPLEVSGQLVTTKKGPAFRGKARARGAASEAATFDLKQRSYGVTLDRKQLTGDQDVSLGGGAREMVLRATDGVREVVWTLSGKPPGTGRGRAARGHAEHREAGRLVQVEDVVVKRKRAVHTVTRFPAAGPPIVRREILRKNGKHTRSEKRTLAPKRSKQANGPRH
ncbi:MAG TPA: hypothetical protein VFQ51_20630 [Vicinamibacteria bacterium]|nr:hypothetical protein [Vicinamibacteria bacterium]